MPNVLVRNLPEDVHRKLEQRAQAAGQSLQQYLTTQLTQLVARPTVDEVFAQLGSETGGRVGLSQAVDDLRRERDRS